MRSILGAIFAFIAFACCISLYGERIDHMISRPVNASVDWLFRALIALGATPRKIAACLA